MGNHDLTKFEKYVVCGTGMYVGANYFDDFLTALLFAFMLSVALGTLVLWIKNFSGGDFN